MNHPLLLFLYCETFLYPMEAAGGIEPPNNGFAVRRLSHLATPPSNPYYNRTDYWNQGSADKSPKLAQPSPQFFLVCSIQFQASLCFNNTFQISGSCWPQGSIKIRLEFIPPRLPINRGHFPWLRFRIAGTNQHTSH